MNQRLYKVKNRVYPAATVLLSGVFLLLILFSLSVTACFPEGGGSGENGAVSSNTKNPSDDDKTPDGEINYDPGLLTSIKEIEAYFNDLSKNSAPASRFKVRFAAAYPEQASGSALTTIWAVGIRG